MLKRSVLIAAVAVIAAGCTDGVLPIAQPELPAIVELILARADEFVTDPSDNVFDLKIPAPLESAEALDGCWASVWEWGTPLDLSVVSIVRFDAATGEYTSWIFQSDKYRLFPVFGSLSGTFEITGDNHIVETITLTRSNDPFTGKIEATEPRDGWFAIVAYVMQLGDELLLAEGAESPADIDPNDVPLLVLRRFDCPE